MKNIKKVFMLVASLGLAVGTISSVWAGSQTKPLSVGHQESTEFKTPDRPERMRYYGASTQKKQDLPDTITVDGVEYKKVRGQICNNGRDCYLEPDRGMPGPPSRPKK